MLHRINLLCVILQAAGATYACAALYILSPRFFQVGLVTFLFNHTQIVLYDN